MSSNGDGYFKVYEEHMKTVRAWFVAYGVGGPVLFITQKEFATVLVGSGSAKLVTVLFLLGVFLQVFVAVLNKWVNWGLYYYNAYPNETRGKWFRWCTKVSGMIWIDIACDIGTFALFSWATVKVLLLVGVVAGAA